MAKAEYQLKGDFDMILRRIDEAVQNSISASLEETSDFTTSSCRMSVRVYERYSWTGSNRVSLSVTLVESEGKLFCSAITSGGSQAVFFKFNTFGEEAFLDTIVGVLQEFSA